MTIIEEKADEDVDGIDDKVHDWTTPLYYYFKEDLSRRNALLIVDGLCIDFIYTLQAIRLLIWGTTYRFYLTAMTFYIIRFLIQYLSVLQFPKEGYNFEYPGFPSIFI